MKLKISLLVLILFITTAATLRCLYKQDNDVRCEVFAIGHGYGYRIIQNNKITIYQPFIPAIRDRKPFATEKDAWEIARLVCAKIKKGELPAVTAAEINPLFFK